MSDVWSQVLDEVRTQIRPEVYNNWFLPIDCSAADADEVVLNVPADYYVQWFESNFGGLLLEILQRHLGRRPSLQFRCVEAAPAPEVSMSRTETPGHANLVGVSPAYNFENFVVGDSNRFAHAAAVGVASRPGESYNPLFIYGKVGLGKTHLMHAVGNEIHRLHPKRRVRYVTCESFVNDVVNMLAHGRRVDEFRTTYRDACDVLLVDDVQFLGGKEKSQIEFFNVFNALFGMRRQIILSCDRYPHEIPGLEQRLQSRFQWGLLVDIEQPDLETRVAILQRKATHFSLDLPTDVAMLIATHIKNNVRELEGALTRLKAFVDFSGKPIDVPTAREALGILLTDPTALLTPDRITRTVASYYSVTVKDLKGKGRKRSITMPRHVAMYLSKTLTAYSYPALAEYFGGRDHTTVLSAVQKIERLLQDAGSEVSRAVSNLKEALSK